MLSTSPVSTNSTATTTSAKGDRPGRRAAFYRRSDVVQALITDISANQVCLAWQAGRWSRLIIEFAALAHAEHSD